MNITWSYSLGDYVTCPKLSNSIFKVQKVSFTHVNIQSIRTATTSAVSGGELLPFWLQPKDILHTVGNRRVWVSEVIYEPTSDKYMVRYGSVTRLKGKLIPKYTMNIEEFAKIYTF